MKESHSFVDVHGQRGRIDLDEEHARSPGIWLRIVETRERYTVLAVEVGEVALRVTTNEVEYGENASVDTFVSDGDAVAFVAAAAVQIENEQEGSLFIRDDMVALITQCDVLETIYLDA